YALNQPSKEAFIKAVTDGLLPPPAYFGMNVAMNKKGYDSFDEVLTQGLKPLTAEEFETAAEATGALILDTRNDNDFAKGFIPQSINIGLNGDFAPWVGAMIVDVSQPILLVTDLGAEQETDTRLSRVGCDNVLGYLKGGFKAWIDAEQEIDVIKRIRQVGFDNVLAYLKDGIIDGIDAEQVIEVNKRITAEQVELEVTVRESKIIDVRKESEYAAEHVEEAYNKPLTYINEWIKDI